VATLFMLAMLAVVGISIAVLLGFVFFVLRLVLWAVFFPIRLILKLLWIPVGLTFGVLGFAFATIALPIILVVGLLAAVAAILLPLAPFILFALLVWAIVRRPPAVA
jgi:hypothetical protein